MPSALQSSPVPPARGYRGKLPRARLLSLLLALCAQQMPAAELSLHALFQDHMILQRDHPIPIFGWGSAGAPVVVELGTSSAEGVVSADGHWRVELPAGSAGGPLSLTVVSAGRKLVVSDVLVGDVWLASGQSNMGYKVREGVKDAANVRAAADLPLIRQYEVPQRPSEAPMNNLAGGQWVVCGSDTVTQFSAVAYFFARKIHRETGVPIGIIHSSWGGSSIEAWIRPEVLNSLPHLPGPAIDLAQSGAKSLVELSAVNEANIKIILKRVDALQEGLDRGVHRPEFDDKAWTKGPIPLWMKLERQIYWMRRTIVWPADATGPVTLSLGVAGGGIHVFLDGGQLIRSGGGTARYEIPAAQMKAGPHVLAVRIANPWFPPYFEGPPREYFLRDAAAGLDFSLADDWKLNGQVEPALPIYYSLQEVPSALFNGMIAPVLDYRMAGIIWYQGEQNTKNADQYRDLFPAMISDWRAQAGQQELPFLFVQLANYGDPAELPETAAGWPLLRQAQAAALALPATGMAVAIDLGDRFDIHPKDKLTVGHRLALSALAVHYGKTIEWRGPVLRTAEFSGSRATLHFDHAQGLHPREGGPLAGFALAGEDQVFHRANAVIVGETVVLACPEVARPVAVRYGWAKNPVTSLYNGAGLPAEPFRTDHWPAVTK